MQAYDSWKTDQANQQIVNRNFQVLNNQPPFQIRYEYKSITDNAEATAIRNIDVESHLFTIDKQLINDACTITAEYKYASNKQLYRTYHKHEVNSPCYPDIDIMAWNNTTRAIHQTVDKRD